MTFFEGLKKKIDTANAVANGARAFGSGLFSLTSGNPKQTQDSNRQESYPESRIQSQQTMGFQPQQEPIYPLEQVESNLRQEAKINAKRICSALKMKGITMKVFFTLMVKNEGDDKLLSEYENRNDVDGLNSMDDLPADVKEALANQIKLEEFNNLTSNVEGDLLELLQETLYQKYRFEYLTGKHQLISEADIIEKYTSIMMTPIWGLAADIFTEKAMKFKKPAIEASTKLIDKFLPKPLTTKDE